MNLPARIFRSYLPTTLSVSPWPWVRRVGLAAALAGALGAGTLFACHAGLPAATDMPLPTVSTKTAGGQQMWSDVAWRDGWRVQQHVWTGHARLLDPGDARRAWGSVEACKTALAAKAPQILEAERPRHVLVLLHGLWRTRGAMAPLKEAFETRGYEVLDLAYPSARRSVAEHAETLAQLLDELPGDGREISFVTHSLGSLVTRALLARKHDPWRTRHTLGRAAFLAPPSTGAAMAEFGARIPGALLIYGKPSREIAAGLAATLPPPPLPFITIAAGRGDGEGLNPLIPGDDDGVVGVAETHLEGEAGSLFLKGSHTFMMREPEAIAGALEFIDRGQVPSQGGPAPK